MILKIGMVVLNLTILNYNVSTRIYGSLFIGLVLLVLGGARIGYKLGLTGKND